MTDTDQKELETLRRMLATPPTPHKKKEGASAKRGKVGGEPKPAPRS
jgi:hypothetical protein